ncbi:MAG: TaqI-like C-terminal specificity domain-containing protein, partial [Cuspidothrix sp.]
DLWLIFTRRGIDINKYPAILNHLSQFRERLTPGIPGGRKAGSYQWYEIQDNISYYKEFEENKIVLGIFMKQATFAYDDQGFFHNNALHLIAGITKYTCAILNSQVGWYFLSSICTDLQNGYLQAYKENLEQIPIPKATDTQDACVTKNVAMIFILIKRHNPKAETRQVY